MLHRGRSPGPLLLAARIALLVAPWRYGAGDDADLEDIEAAWHKAFEASRVTLTLEKASPRDAYLALARASGNALLVPVEGLEAAPTVSLSVTDEPFWEVMQKLEKLAPVQLLSSASPSQTAVKWKDRPDSPYAVVAGPVRIRLESCAARRNLWQPLAENARPRLEGSGLVFTLRIDVEPRVTVAHAALDITEVTDQDGSSLLRGERSQDRSVSHVLGKPGVLMVTLNGRASMPGPRSKRLQSVKGRLRLSVTPALPAVRIPVDSEPGLQVPYGERSLIFKGTARDSKGGYTVTFASQKSLPEMELNNLERARLAGTNAMLRSAASCDCEEIEDWPFRVRLYFPGVKGCEPREVLVPRYAGFRERSYDFEFHDVPLPAQDAVYPRGPGARGATPPERAVPTPPDWILPLEEMKTRTYSRDGGEVPLAEFLADVAKQTGVKARGQELEPELLQRWGVNPIVVRPNYRGAGFWEIMDDLCARHSLYYVPVQEGYFGKGDDTGIRLMRDRNPLTAGQGRPSFVRYLGPLRFCLSQVGFEAESAVHYRADRHEIHEKLGLWVIAGTLMLPGVRTLRRSAGIQECITNAGENLVTLADRDPSADSHTLKGTRYLRDPRSPRITSTHDDGGPNFGESFPIDPGAVPASLARVRIYYYTDVYDEDAVFELAKLGEPGEHPLGDDFLLKWHGIIEEYGRREARLTLERKAGKSPVGYPYDVLRRVELLDQAGERISGGISHHEDTNLCRLFLRDGAVPVKLRVPYPKGLRTYAGFVVFRDIPLVPLPGRR